MTGRASWGGRGLRAGGGPRRGQGSRAARSAQTPRRRCAPAADSLGSPRPSSTQVPITQPRSTSSQARAELPLNFFELMGQLTDADQSAEPGSQKGRGAGGRICACARQGAGSVPRDAGAGRGVPPVGGAARPDLARSRVPQCARGRPSSACVSSLPGVISSPRSTPEASSLPAPRVRASTPA